MKTNIQFLYYLTHFFLEWYVFQIIVVEETYIFGSTAFMFENGVVYEIMWKNFVESERWRQQVRLHDVMSQKKTNFNFIFIYLYILMLYMFLAIFFYPLLWFLTAIQS